MAGLKGLDWPTILCYDDCTGLAFRVPKQASPKQGIQESKQGDVMTSKCQLWSRGIGSMSIILCHASVKANAAENAKTKWDDLNSALTSVMGLPDADNVLRQLGVSLINRDLVNSGQLFEVNDDKCVVESFVQIEDFRRLLHTLIYD